MLFGMLCVTGGVLILPVLGPELVSPCVEDVSLLGIPPEGVPELVWAFAVVAMAAIAIVVAASSVGIRIGAISVLVQKLSIYLSYSFATRTTRERTFGWGASPNIFIATFLAAHQFKNFNEIKWLWA
jgi:hypothetical protein